MLRSLDVVMTEPRRTQSFFDCATAKNAFAAGCDVRLVGTQAVKVTERTL